MFSKYMEKRTGKSDNSLNWEAWEKVFDPTKKSPWQGKDFPEVAGWLAENAGAMNHAAQASRLRHYFVPLFSRKDPPELFSVDLEGLGYIRDLGDAFSSRCMLEMGQGDAAAAWADSIVELRLGLLLMQGPTNMACDRQGTILRELHLDISQAKKLSAEIETIGPLPGLDEALDVHERYTSLDMIMRMVYYGPDVDERATGTPPQRANTLSFGLMQLIRVDPILYETNGWWDRMVAAAREPVFSVRDSQLGKVAADARRAEPSLATWPRSSHNAVRLLGFTFLSDFRRDFRRHTMTEQHLDMIRDSLLAVERFGPGEEASEQVVAQWSKALPPDRFTGESIACSFGGGRVTFTSDGPSPLPDTELIGMTFHDSAKAQSVSVRIR